VAKAARMFCEEFRKGEELDVETSADLGMKLQEALKDLEGECST